MAESALRNGYMKSQRKVVAIGAGVLVFLIGMVERALIGKLGPVVLQGIARFHPLWVMRWPFHIIAVSILAGVMVRALWTPKHPQDLKRRTDAKGTAKSGGGLCGGPGNRDRAGLRGEAFR